MTKLQKTLLLVTSLICLFILLEWTSHSQFLDSTIVNSGRAVGLALPIIDPVEISQDLNTSESATNFTHLVAGIKKFVFFVGYARSGHSIIGSLMDAHPHIVTSNEFYLFSHFSELNKVPEVMWKHNLFGLLYNKSIHDAEGIRRNSKKGYTLAVGNFWQGKFDRYIEVIGDKSGGETTITYLKDKKAFEENYAKLKRMLSMPIRIIHAVRNPFDIISTKYIYTAMRSNDAHNLSGSALYALLKSRMSDGALKTIINKSFKQFTAVSVMIEEVFGRENVLEVHNCELVDNPKEVMSRIFRFLQVDASEQFLDICAAKVFKSVSRSRERIIWSPVLRKVVEEKMKHIEVFSRYSFTSD